MEPTSGKKEFLWSQLASPIKETQRGWVGHPETKEENSLQRAELCVQAMTGLPWMGSLYGSWQLGAVWTFALFCQLQFHHRHKLTPVGLLKVLTCLLSESGSQRGETEDRGLVSQRPPEERTSGTQAVFPPGFRVLPLNSEGTGCVDAPPRA